jgi:hypothetical protein
MRDPATLRLDSPCAEVALAREAGRDGESARPVEAATRQNREGRSCRPAGRAEKSAAVVHARLSRDSAARRISSRRAMADSQRAGPGHGERGGVHQYRDLRSRNAAHAELRPARTGPCLPRPGIGLRGAPDRRRLCEGEKVRPLCEGGAARCRRTPQPRPGVCDDPPQGILRRGERGLLFPQRLLPLHAGGIEAAGSGVLQPSGSDLERASSTDRLAPVRIRRASLPRRAGSGTSPGHPGTSGCRVRTHR